MRLGTDTKHSEAQNLFSEPNAPPPSALFFSVVWIATTTPTQRLNHMRFHKEWAIVSAMRGLVVLLDHDSRKYILRTSALFRSFSFRCQSSQQLFQISTTAVQDHQDATSHDNYGYPSSHRPTIDSVFIDSRCVFVFGSRSHSDFGRGCLSYQCHRCEGS